MYSKRFSKRDYKDNDPQAKQETVVALPQIDPKFNLRTPLSEQTEAYKLWDITIYYGDDPINVEAERKRVWLTNDGTFPYTGIDVPARKWESQAQLYVLFNASLDALAMTEMKNVLNAPIITKSTSMYGEHLTTNEAFFRVPVEQFRFYTKATGVWQRV